MAAIMKAILAALLLLAPLCPAASLTLARGGRSDYAILVGSQASPSERRAATELQEHLRQITGATLPLLTDAAPANQPLIFVGRSPALDAQGVAIPYDQLGDEGYVLKTSGRHLIIAGGRLRGAMYGVYGFLDRLGCRWFAPGVSRIPKRPVLQVPALDVTEKPAFEYRETFFTEAWDKDWSARNRLNGQSHKLDESTGGKVQYYPFVHSFLELVPPEKYFKDHPEYFSLIDGERRAERGQLCLTNPDVLRIGVESVRRWIREHPEAKIISVSQNDWQGWCECDNCRRVEEQEGGVHSGPILHYVNRVAEQIEKTNPGILIDTLAYWYSERPPRHVRPRPNVRIRLCPIGACEAHPYEQCPYNRFFVSLLKEWSRITNQLYIWHYNTNFSHYLLPFPDFDELAADIPMYKRHGVVGLFLQGAYAPGGGGENAHLRSYLMARLLWNPGLHPEREIDDFLEAYYEKAAKPMRAYFDLLHRQVRMPPRGAGHHLWIFVHPRMPFLNRAFLDEARALFAKAEAAANNETVRRRVDQARMPIDYVELSHARQFVLRGGTYGPADLESLQRRFTAFVARAKSYGIEYFSEARKVDDHAEAFARRIRPYRAYTLENASLRVTVVPELGGRIVEIAPRATGQNVLRVPDAGSWGYPDLSGAWALAAAGYHGKTYEVQWDPEAETAGNELRLSASGPGLRLRRTIALREVAVHTETEVENTGADPLPVALAARADYSPADDLDGTQLALRYRPVEGAEFDRALFVPGEETNGAATLRAGERPAGEWVAYHRSGVPGLINRFPLAQAERCTMQWTLRGAPLVTLGLWSREANLRPGEKLSLAAEYALSPGGR